VGLSLDDVIRERVNAAIRAGITCGELTAPLINNLAYVIAATSVSHDPAMKRQIRDELTETVRNELDEAIAHYDKVLSR